MEKKCRKKYADFVCCTLVISVFRYLNIIHLEHCGLLCCYRLYLVHLQKSVSGNICWDIPSVSKNPVKATLLVGFSYKLFLFLLFRTTIIVTSSFLDAFQKVADIATGTRGKMRCLPSLSLSLSAVSPHKQYVSPVMIMRKAGSRTSQERLFKH